MKITRITKIKNYRIFRDFIWPAELLPFAQFNVIYGWNCSGKTTLSSLFRYLQDCKDITESQVEFELNSNVKITGNNISTATLPSVRVFNRDFIAETLRSIGSNQVAPIYFLGADSIKEQQQVESLKDQLQMAEEKVKKYTDIIKQTKKKQDDFSIDNAKLIKEALLGNLDYASYDKRNYNQAVEKLKRLLNLPTALTISEKEKLHKQKESKAKLSISIIPITLPDLTQLRNQTLALLQRSIASQTLDALAADPKVGAWVQVGLTLHSGEYKTDMCRFCNNDLTIDRRSALEAHFNDAFSSFQVELNEAIQDINNKKNNLSSLQFPDESRFYDHLIPGYRTVIMNTRELLKQVIQVFNNLQNALQEKKNAPFRSIKLEEDNLTLDALIEAVNSVNVIIKKHEDFTLNLSNEIKKACQLIEQDLVLESLQKFNDLENAVKESTNILNTAKDRTQILQQQIYGIELRIIEHRTPAEELNKELIAYLGRDELRFEVRETGYVLTRSGHPAINLSEGECTAIAFLYFLKSLEDKSFNIKSGIVVIDDPVSSLDANTLFSAFAYMKERTKNAGQLFIFTHNFGFFRQVKNWFHHQPGQNKKDNSKHIARFYSLISDIYEAKRSSKLSVMDSLLEEFESEYHFLFKQIYEIAHNSATTELAQFYGIPNIARRLIETFLAYRYPDCRGDLLKCFERISFDHEKKTRILRLLHTYSHSGGISDPEHDPSILSETKQVLLDMFVLMKALDLDHFMGMEKLVRSSVREVPLSSSSKFQTVSPNQPMLDNVLP